MNSKLYIGNLSFNVKEEELSALFADFGEVKSARIITDRESGRSRGFAFVEMGEPDQAQAALDALNGQDFSGRALRVSEAKEREERPRGGRPPRQGGNF